MGLKIHKIFPFIFNNNFKMYRIAKCSPAAIQTRGYPKCATAYYCLHLTVKYIARLRLKALHQEKQTTVESKL
jgi:hypothetical protein